MSVHAGSILHIGGRNIIDRIQSAGLGDVKITNEVIRETGNDKIVDKIPGDPDFTFTLESFDVSTELEAFLQGKVGAGAASAQGPGAGDADGTEYKWSNCGFVNIPSPWKDPATGSAGVVDSGHLIPGYYPTRMTYNFGVTSSASEHVEMAGGSFYYNGNAPVEEIFTGDGSRTAFATTTPAVPYRIGGTLGTSFKSIFGVIVNGELQTEGVDYTQTPSNTAAPGTATLNFTAAPATGTVVRMAYFTTAGQAYPDTEHAAVAIKPGAVRGRHICVYVGAGGARQKVGSVQTFTLDATVQSTVEREMCNEEIVGVTIDGRDCVGTMVVRSKNKTAFLNLLAKVTGVAVAEVLGFLNTNPIPIEVQILNPKNPAQVLKTLYVSDGIFQPPGHTVTPNSPVDFNFQWESQSGDFSVYKGAKP